MGTPAYMAPEQLMGQPADHRTDQYSFCVALYQGLYGELPFKGQSVETLLREMSQGKAPEVASSVRVPSRLRRAVLRGLRAEPADRYPSMDTLLDELVLQSTRTRRRLWALAVLAIVTAIAMVRGIASNKRNAAQPSVQSIAILPLKNIGDASDEATVDNLTSGLTTTVAQLSSADVIAQNSASRYKTSPKSLQEIGRELNVDAVVSGSAKRSGSRIQIDTKLTRVATGQQFWTKIFESESGQLPMLQADIAAGLLAEVESRRITPEQQAQLDKLRTVKPEVYEACLKGWLLMRRSGLTQKSIAYFQEAIRQDPAYAPAYAGLAEVYTGNWGAPEAPRLATEAVMKALSLDPKLGEAHAVLAFVKIQLDHDWRAAEEEAKRAIELSPNDAYAHARYSMVLFLLYPHRLDESLTEAKRAQRLDPLNVLAQQQIALYFLEKKQYDKAIEEFRKGIELEPNTAFLHALLSKAYHDAGRYAEALAEAQKSWELNENPSGRAGIAHMLVHLGKTEEAEKIIEEIKNGPNSIAAWGNIATFYALLKRKEEALKWLEYGFETRSYGLLLIAQNRLEEFAWLRSDPRFQALIKRVGWPQ
jgi:TolB-like protein/tetratricopeptide (TPR) repeat protein